MIELIDKLNSEAKNIYESAREEAFSSKSQTILPHHFLIAILANPESIAFKTLKESNIDPDLLLKKIKKMVIKGTAQVVKRDLKLDNVSLQLINFAAEIAKQTGDILIGSQHLLLAMLLQENTLATKALSLVKADFKKIAVSIKNVLTESKEEMKILIEPSIISPDREPQEIPQKELEKPKPPHIYNVAIYPGSFDCVTYGHLDLIKRASAIFDLLYVCVAHNLQKNPLFTVQERVMMLKNITYNIDNVIVEDFDYLTIDFAREKGANVIIRGLRAVSDFEWELQLAMTNKEMTNNVETLFFAPSTEYSFLSSRMIKEIAQLGGDVLRFVPPIVYEMLRLKFQSKGE